jgi:pseudouridine synthase
MQERLQKYLARSGVASRRQAEQMMLDGRVTVNGAVTRELGVKVDADKDAVKVDGKRVHGEESAYVLLYKPKGTICTLDDPEQRPTVMELVRGVKARLFPVGRLDFDTTGALLLTNDGELANLLMHPRHRFSKTYLAKVKGIPTEERLEKLRRGVNIEGVRTAPAEVRMVSVKEKNSLVEVILREGRNRQVKRMFLEIGHPVVRLHRSAYAFLTLEGLEPTQWRPLAPEEVQRLRSAAVRADSAATGGPETFKPRLSRPLKKPREFAPRAVEARKDAGPRPASVDRRPGPRKEGPRKDGPRPASGTRAEGPRRDGPRKDGPRKDGPRVGGRVGKSKPRGQGGR